MKKMKFKNLKFTHSIFKQLLVVWMAFFVMVFLSYWFVKDIVHDYLAREAENTLSYVQSKISTDLREGETTLQGASQSIRGMILRGNSAEVIHEYMIDITEYLSSANGRISGFNGVYGCFDIFDELFLDGTYWEPPDDYNPRERPWYTAAEESGGITATTLYIAMLTGEPAISYSRRIYDDDNNPLAVICVDVNMNEIYDYVINTRLADSGYGMLITDNLEIVAAPSKEYLGHHLSDLPHKGIPFVVDSLQNGIDIREHIVVDDQLDIDYILFTKQLENDWYVGILTPIDQYYQKVTTMRNFIATLGILLALTLSYILFHLQGIVEEKTRGVSDLQNALLKTMAELLESRDDITGGHIERTQQGIKFMLEEIQRSGLYPEETKEWDIELLLQSSQLHDVGKISISDSVLKKPGDLTEEEFSYMMRHTSFGEEIIEKVEALTKESEFLKYAKIFASSHHERWDGNGYHNGHAGHDIPLLGRIMAIADVYDALTSERPYKEAFTHEESVRIINEGSGTRFDPSLVEVFNNISEQFRSIRNNLEASAK